MTAMNIIAIEDLQRLTKTELVHIFPKVSRISCKKTEIIARISTKPASDEQSAAIRDIFSKSSQACSSQLVKLRERAAERCRRYWSKLGTCVVCGH